MKELFKEQIEKAIPLTQEQVDQLMKSTTTDGEEIEVGDKVLYYLNFVSPSIPERVESNVVGLTQKYPETQIRVERTCERLLDKMAEQFESFGEQMDGTFPRLKRK